MAWCELFKCLLLSYSWLLLLMERKYGGVLDRKEHVSWELNYLKGIARHSCPDSREEIRKIPPLNTFWSCLGFQTYKLFRQSRAGLLLQANNDLKETLLFLGIVPLTTCNSRRCGFFMGERTLSCSHNASNSIVKSVSWTKDGSEAAWNAKRWDCQWLMKDPYLALDLLFSRCPGVLMEFNGQVGLVAETKGDVK